MASSSYPSVLLLDDRNNPITPLVDVDSIYMDVQEKKPVSIVCDTSTDYIASEDKIVAVGTDATDLYIKSKDNVQSELPVAILTDVSIGPGTVSPDGSVVYPSHVLNFQKIDLNKLLTKWYEEVYMRNQNGYEIWYGTSKSIPDEYIPSDKKVIFEDGGSVILDSSNLNHVIDGQEYPNRMFRINDYNSTNFLSTDDSSLPRRGKVYPSAEYIWFIIIVSDQKGVNTNTLHFYGASGEDSPQEIELGNIKSVESGAESSEIPGAVIGFSASTFGIDSELNGNNVDKDGFEYNIYVKYKFANS